MAAESNAPRQAPYNSGHGVSGGGLWTCAWARAESRLDDGPPRHPTGECRPAGRVPCPLVPEAVRRRAARASGRRSPRAAARADRHLLEGRFLPADVRPGGAGPGPWRSWKERSFQPASRPRGGPEATRRLEGTPERTFLLAERVFGRCVAHGGGASTWRVELERTFLPAGCRSQEGTSVLKSRTGMNLSSAHRAASGA